MKYGIGKFEETELVKVPGYNDIENVREFAEFCLQSGGFTIC